MFSCGGGLGRRPAYDDVPERCSHWFATPYVGKSPANTHAPPMQKPGRLRHRSNDAHGARMVMEV